MAGKAYNAALEAVDREKLYAPLDAVRTLKTLQTAKFDETVEVHMRLGLNVRHAEQQLRGTLFLPHGTGRSVTVAVFAQGEKAKEAEEAGADHVGGEDLAAKVLEGFSDFDVAIATPDMMGTVGKLGRVLGPQGKMPSPKAGTITFDITKAVSDIKSGKIEYRTDRTAIVHAAIGKKSFDERALVENYGAVLEEILRVKPAAAKGRYLKSVTMASTMGPGFTSTPPAPAICSRRPRARAFLYTASAPKTVGASGLKPQTRRRWGLVRPSRFVRVHHQVDARRTEGGEVHECD